MDVSSTPSNEPPRQRRGALSIEITSQQSHLRIRRQQLAAAVRSVLEDQQVLQARISLAVVDDPAIQQLNRRFLNRNCPTDVLSFVLDRRCAGPAAGAKRGPETGTPNGRNCRAAPLAYLEGEVVVSAQTAQAEAGRFGWSAHDELLLYVVHGTLHLIGYEDATPESQAEMRCRERACLARFGLEPSYEQSDADPLAPEATVTSPDPGGKKLA